MLSARFGSTYTKIGTIQRRLAWPLRKDDMQIREAFHIFQTTNLTESVLLELNQELGGVQVVALQNLTTIDYLRLKEHMGCEQIPEMGCFV